MSKKKTERRSGREVRDIMLSGQLEARVKVRVSRYLTRGGSNGVGVERLLKWDLVKSSVCTT